MSRVEVLAEAILRELRTGHGMTAEARALQIAHLVEGDLLARGAPTAECGQDSPLTTEVDEPCGSQRLIESYEGLDVRVRWCDRTAGPCPFPGTAEASASDRKCADSPGRRLNVVYAGSLVLDARRRLRQFADSSPGVMVLNEAESAVHVAIAALTACIGSEEDPGI